MEICTTIMGRVIDSIKDAVAVDDTALEDELDAYYPTWSRTDFEFDPLPDAFGATVEELVNAELDAARTVEVDFLARSAALAAG